MSLLVWDFFLFNVPCTFSFTHLNSTISSVIFSNLMVLKVVSTVAASWCAATVGVGPGVAAAAKCFFNVGGVGIGKIILCVYHSDNVSPGFVRGSFG